MVVVRTQKAPWVPRASRRTTVKLLSLCVALTVTNTVWLLGFAPQSPPLEPAPRPLLESEVPPLSVIAIGCNRPDGLRRTLNSVRDANVPRGTKLHICVDGCGVRDVEDVATDFAWEIGEKQVTIRNETFGLARHITSCWEAPSAGEWALFLEDDVILAPHAFNAFMEAWRIRNAHEFGGSIKSIALHDSRVNQYCWKSHVNILPCTQVQKECNLQSSTWTDGALQCMKQQSHGSWAMSQVPSSWGAFYEGKAWSMFKSYYKARVRLSVGESLLLEVPHSMSNEWKDSWKRFLLELMFRAGWTSMYRIHESHRGYSTTLRSTGVHTERSPAQAELERRRRCLQSTPLDTKFSTDRKLIKHPTLMNSLDYCSIKTPVRNLLMQGTASVSFLTTRYLDSKRPLLKRCLKVLQEANTETQSRLGISGNQTILSSGYNVEWKGKAEVVVITRFTSKAKDFAASSEHFRLHDGKVHFIVVAPRAVCQGLLRGNIHATCVDDSLVELDDTKLPVFSAMLRVAADFAGPNVQWIGFMSGDVWFDGQALTKTLSTISTFNLCVKDRCVVTGHESEVANGWTDGLDYVLFNRKGVEFVLRDGSLPSFTVGRPQWGRQLVEHLASSHDIHALDASAALKLSHYMNFWELAALKSKLPSISFWNHNVTNRIDEIVTEPRARSSKPILKTRNTGLEVSV